MYWERNPIMFKHEKCNCRAPYQSFNSPCFPQLNSMFVCDRQSTTDHKNFWTLAFVMQHVLKTSSLTIPVNAVDRRSRRYDDRSRGETWRHREVFITPLHISMKRWQVDITPYYTFCIAFLCDTVLPVYVYHDHMYIDTCIMLHSCLYTELRSLTPANATHGVAPIMQQSTLSFPI